MDLTCPKCQAPMRSYERNGVTVDQCSECRGLFLDRGELERLIDAENAWHAGSGPAPQQAATSPDPRLTPGTTYGYPPHDQHQQYGYGKPPKKRKSFLEELFD